MLDLSNILDKNGALLPIPENKKYERLSKEDTDLMNSFDGSFRLKILKSLGANQSLYKCPVCFNELSDRALTKNIKRWDDIKIPDVLSCCSKRCSSSYNSSRILETRNKNYGGREEYKKHIKELQHNNSIKKYGKPFQALDSTLNKRKETMLERYGVQHNSMLGSVKKGRMVIEDGAIVNVLKTKKSMETRKITLYNKSDEQKFNTIKKRKETRERNSKIDYNILYSIDKRITITKLADMAKCSNMTSYRFLKNNGLMTTRFTQSTIVEYIKSICDLEILENDRKIIKPKELDIYIPEKKLAIEYDGLYWHSSNDRSKDKEKSKYHLMKTELCEEQGINLLHIFENEWLDPVKNYIWKSVIKHKLGLSKKIYARKCSIKLIDNKIANYFIENNHLQGKCTGTKISYGLYYEGKLVQVATFGKPRYTSGYDYELLRMCSENGLCIVGGASKLMNILDGNIVSYGNRRWCSSITNVYNKVLKYKSKSDPCYYYIDGVKLYHRSSFMKHKLKDKLKNFDDSLTEVENCYNNGLRRIWDCGNLVYERK